MKITEIKRNLLGADIAYGKRDIPSIDDQEDEIKVISPKKQTKLIKKLNSLRSNDININLQLINENIFLYLRKNKETKKLTDIQQSVNIIGINNFDNLCYFNAIIHSLLFVDIIEHTLENIHMDSSNALLYIIKKIKNSVGKNSTRIRTTYNKIQSAYMLLLSKLGYNNNEMQSYKVGLNLIKKIFIEGKLRKREKKRKVKNIKKEERNKKKVNVKTEKKEKKVKKVKKEKKKKRKEKEKKKKETKEKRKEKKRKKDNKKKEKKGGKKTKKQKKKKEKKESGGKEKRKRKRRKKKSIKRKEKQNIKRAKKQFQRRQMEVDKKMEEEISKPIIEIQGVIVLLIFEKN
ncbi:hsp20-like chaperones superfamily protein [Anaeramoeba flamelloides]|uniref:Hsp20-like chaperones superfamily protein n=1 Tax=Anaeramoeba flamelloides TaxID=1746091 RepID=A0ABQ8ZCZ2_9EUKA|nr:hsp20-like chaperones superfamily protein [Anaeramoeba flamelloides]